MDSMQDIITSMEEDKKQTNEFLEDIRKQLRDSQPKLMEAEFKQQKTKRERDSLQVQLNEIELKLGQHQELAEVM